MKFESEKEYCLAPRAQNEPSVLQLLAGISADVVALKTIPKHQFGQEECLDIRRICLELWKIQSATQRVEDCALFSSLVSSRLGVLNREVLELIFQDLSPMNLGVVAQTCQLFKDLVNSVVSKRLHSLNLSFSVEVPTRTDLLERLEYEVQQAEVLVDQLLHTAAQRTLATFHKSVKLLHMDAFMAHIFTLVNQLGEVHSLEHSVRAEIHDKLYWALADLIPCVYSAEEGRLLASHTGGFFALLEAPEMYIRMWALHKLAWMPAHLVAPRINEIKSFLEDPMYQRSALHAVEKLPAASLLPIQMQIEALSRYDGASPEDKQLAQRLSFDIRRTLNTAD
ncbi:MAG: hypothetical protein SGPRY_004650 [Prymnesium sp.]